MPLRDFVSRDSLRWVLRHRAWTTYYLVRYWRFLVLRVRTGRWLVTGAVRA